MTRSGQRLRWATAWLLASTLLVACFRGIDWSSVALAAARARPLWLVAAVVADLSIVVLWAAQWKLFLPRGRDVPFPRMLRITAVMAMTANSVPYLAGQATGVHLLATRGGIGHAAALSVATIDQVAEGIAKVAVLAVVVLALPVPETLRSALPVLAAAVCALALVTLAAATRPRALYLLLAWASRQAQSFESAVFPQVGRFLARWGEGLDGVRRPGVLPPGVGLALLMKLAEAASMVAVQTSLGVQIPFATTLVVLAAVSLATMLPLAPGNLGVYEGAALLAYRWGGVDAETALALALLQHVALLAAMGGAGWAAVTLRRAGAGAHATDPIGL